MGSEFDFVRCSKCAGSFPHTAEFWPLSKGEPRRDICKKCNRERFKTYNSKKYKADKLRQDLAVGTAPQPMPPESTNLPAIPGKRRLQIGTALNIGADYVNRHAASILDRVIFYANHPESPHHEWALRMLADRVLPSKLYSDIGAAEAGVGKDTGSHRPPVTIIIQPANPAVPNGSARVVTVQPIEEEPDADSGPGETVD